MALTRITQGVIKPNQNYDTHDINSTGIVTATGLNISGNASIGGVLTYEDVTNIDSIGIITARNGLIVSGVTTTAAVSWGGHMLPTSNAAYDIGSADYKVRHLFLSDNSLKFVDSSDTEHPLSVDSGRLKFAGGMLLGNNIKMDTTSGIITATNFAKADGSSLGGVQSDSDYNTVGGSGAGAQLTGSSLRNTFFGWDAGTAHQSGEKNTFVGAIAGKFQISSNYNTGFGDAALCQNSGSFNTGVGYNAAAGESERLTMEHTVAVGYNALRKIDEADFNVAMGSRALENCVTGNSNIAIGYKSLFNANASSDNVAIGSSTGINLSSAANENTFIGYNAGQGVTTGDRNTAIGMNAMASTDYSSGGKTGTDNIAIGRNTMSRNTGSGSNNVFIGSGNCAYRCSNGSNNIGIGQYTFYYLTTGNSNIALGNQALDYCDTGHSNIALGQSALTELTGGSGTNNGNIAIGSGVATNLQNGANNIILGQNATTSAATVSNEITLGNANITNVRIPGVHFSITANATSLPAAIFRPGVIQETYFNDTGGGIQSNHTHDILTYGMVWNGVTNAVGAWTFNIRGDASTTFNSLTSTGKVTTMTMYSANNSTSNYMTAFKIDGTTQTVKWAGGSAPSAATGSGVDVYSMTIMKTGANTYHVFGNVTNFA